jgi:hypothetical protein
MSVYLKSVGLDLMEFSGLAQTSTGIALPLLAVGKIGRNCRHAIK